MRHFDRFTLVWGLCILALGYAMSANGWLVGDDVRAGLFAIEVDGRTHGWPRDLPTTFAAGRYLALLGCALAIAATSAAMIYGGPRLRPWIAAALFACTLAIAAFRVLLKLSFGADRAGVSWWLALAAVLVALVGVGLCAPTPEVDASRVRP